MGNFLQDPHLISAWRFEGEVAGDDAEAEGVFENDLTDRNSNVSRPTTGGPFSDAPYYALFLAALDSQLVRADLDAIFLGLNTARWTVAFYINKIGAWSKSVDEKIIGKDIQAPFSDRTWQIKYDSTAKELQLIISADGSSAVTLGGGHTPASSTWEHWAWTFDGTDLKVYWDGVEQDTTDTWTGPTNTNSHPFVIGSSSDFDTLTDYQGGLDEIAIFQRALSPAELLVLARDGLAGKRVPLSNIAVDCRSLLAPHVDDVRWTSRNESQFPLEPRLGHANPLGAKLDHKSLLEEITDANS